MQGQVNQRKKICIVVPAHIKALMGGAEYQASLLTDYLVETNAFDVYYLARKVDESFQPQGYTIRRVARPDGIRRFGEFFDAFDLMRLLKEISPDAIYQRVGCGYTGICAYYAKNYNSRCVWHIAHDREVMPFDTTLTKNIAFRFIDKKFQEYGVRHADAIIAQTEQQAKLLLQHYHLKPTAVIPNVHPSAKGNLEKKGPVTVAWVANVKSWKRPEIFIELAKDLGGRENVRFVMIGKPTGKQDWCDNILAKIGQTTNLEFMGEQPQQVVNEVLEDAHIFVNTSVQEGFANTFIQAWLRKVPVLSLTVNPDGIFNEKKYGICSNSYDELRKNLEMLIDNSQLRNEMGASAQKYALERFSTRNFSRVVDILLNDAEI